MAVCSIALPADALDILELLVEASNRRDKVMLREDINRRLEVLRRALVPDD